MDQISLERIKTLHPKIRKEVLELYTKANNLELGKGVRLRLSYTFRTNEEQDELFKKRPKITNAKGGQSIHNYGLAFDIVLMYDKDGDGKFEEVSWDTKRDGDKDGISDWLEVTKVFISAGYINGFITNGKKWDLPHFQKDFGLSWQKMKYKIDNNDYISETINGYTYKYINI